MDPSPDTTWVDGDAPVPAYTELASTDDISSSLDALLLEARKAGTPLPLTVFSSPVARITTAFFRAVSDKNDELVTLFVQRGLVSPDVPDAWGQTPLIAAVAAGSGAMVCTLVRLGASLDLPGVYFANSTSRAYVPPKQRIPRTALMVAAARGNLALVQLLMELGADDGIIAPDGALALRLAADNGHRDVVAFLPARRGGAFRRWKTHHAKAMLRVRKAVGKIGAFGKFFGWYVPKFLLWDLPKYVVVLPVKKGVEYCWAHKGEFGGWCVRQVCALPGRVKAAAESVWRGVVKIPGAVVRCVVYLGKVVGRIPAAARIVGEWVWESLKKVGVVVGDVVLAAASAVHTAVMAAVDFFRTITLRDVWNGVVRVVTAVVVDLPVAVWAGVREFGEMSYAVMKALFGLCGQVLWWIARGLLWVANYVPRQLGKIVAGMGASVGKGFHEVMVWFDPKH
ncbi:hypothetical protein B0T22DRAFT_506012 [Podospora appendiculata]|uniref:Ankyrin n=1 Tax=Podospora appendiculata TaxID=314037 RepID=A0AAE0XID2_9PEZI|nr:hypothetical protein B0T22DRAFT_506012 [Podospora appendiculata]